MIQKEVSIVCFAWDPWSQIWKMTQQLLWHLSKKQEVNKILYLNKDLYISNLAENFISYFLNQRQRRRYLKSILGKVDRHNEKISIFTPFHYLPFSYRYVGIEKINQRLLLKKLKQILKQHKFHNIILFINRIVDMAILDSLPDTIMRCFYWSDDWSSFPLGTKKVSEIELEEKNKTNEAVEKILKRSDIIFGMSQYLTEIGKNYIPYSYWLPCGTDYENFVKADLKETPISDDIQFIPRPIIGFMGFITSSLDFDLLLFTARCKPNWSFVFIGPKLPAASWGEEFFKLNNVHYLGAQSYFDLPKYMKAFDVCIIPYSNHPSLQAADSNKVYDYLATGKPIIASYKTAGLEKFERLIKISGSKEKFVTDIEASLNEKDSHLISERKSMARENSWKNRADYMWDRIKELLE